VANRAGHDGAAEQAVALETDQQLGEAMGRLGPEQPAADTQRSEVRLVTGALGELGGSLDEPFGVERGADDGLWVEVDYGTLLLGDSSSREGCPRLWRHTSRACLPGLAGNYS
jgi:hypothetical protein